MKFSALKRLLSNDNRFKEDTAEYSRAVLLNALLLLYCGVSLLLAFLCLAGGFHLAAGAGFAAAVLSAVIFIGFHITDWIMPCAYGLFAVVLCMLGALLPVAGQMHFAYAWACVYPPVVFFLLSQKKARLAIVALVVFFVVFLFLGYRSWGAAALNASAIIGVLVSAAVLLVMSAYFALIQEGKAPTADSISGSSELEQINKELTESREQLRLILNSTAEAIFGVDMELRCTFCNVSCLEMLGLRSEGELLGKDIHELIHDRRKDGTPIPKMEDNIIRTCMEGIAIHADDEVFWRPGGTFFDVEYNSYPQYKDDELVGAVVTFTDNTLKKIHEQQIEYYSSHDSLTGLLNRSYFETMLNRIDNKNNLPISVIMGDLNGLKLTNDVFGHGAGDELLVKTAEVLKKVCRSSDLIARIGGDEFVVLLPKTQQKDALMIIARMKECLSEEKVSAIRCSMSLGCDAKTAVTQSIDMTMKNAESEMYREKAKSRGTVNADMINALIMSLYSKDPGAEQHADNVSDICKMLGEALELPETEVAVLRSAGLLHDIGKVGMESVSFGEDEAIVESEDAEYKQHPVIGYRILNLFDHTLNLAEGVYSQHEHWDGTGFPRGLSGSTIPLAGRILALAERYDTLLTEAAADGSGRAVVLSRLQQEAGTVLDPQLVELFVGLMAKENS